VQRLRLRYAKRGRARFASHRDFVRAFERALRRADVPMAYSSGFNPHPRISYANSAPTGAASEAEYLEIGLAERCDPLAVLDALRGAMPEGLDIVDIVEAEGGRVGDGLEASHWRVELPGVTPEALTRAAATFLAAEHVPTERMTKHGPRTFDARADVIAARVLGSDRVAVLDLVIRHDEPLVRPDDVLRVLESYADDVTPADPPRLTRLAQGVLAGETVVSPW